MPRSDLLVKWTAAVTRRVHPRGTYRLVRMVHNPVHRPWAVKAVVRMSDGMRVYTDTSSWLEWRVFFFGDYEPETRQLLGACVRPGHSAIDVGANIGLHTLALAKAAHPGRVLAAEPNPSVLGRLKKNLVLNELTNVLVTDHAIGAARGRLVLNLPAADAANQATASLVSHATASLAGGTGLEVEISTLDQLVDENGLKNVDVVKIDVEGYEVPVLQGAAALLKRDRPILIFEYCREFWTDAGHQLSECLSILRECGYGDFFEVTDEGGLRELGRDVPPMINILALDGDGKRRLSGLVSK